MAQSSKKIVYSLHSVAVQKLGEWSTVRAIDFTIELILGKCLLQIYYQGDKFIQELAGRRGEKVKKLDHSCPRKEKRN
jgi:hypothetical protein